MSLGDIVHQHFTTPWESVVRATLSHTSSIIRLTVTTNKRKSKRGKHVLSIVLYLGNQNYIFKTNTFISMIRYLRIHLQFKHFYKCRNPTSFVVNVSPYNRAIPTSVARTTLSQGVVKCWWTNVTQWHDRRRRVVASNHGWGLSIPYRSIHAVPALIQD